MKTSKMKSLFIAVAALCSVLMTEVASAETEIAAGATTESDSPAAVTRAQVHVQCESWNYQFNRCRVGQQIRDVRIYRQLSNNNDGACNRGYSWGFDQDSIWVDRGCRAIFAVGVSGGGGNPGYPPPGNPGYPGYPGNDPGYPGGPGYPGNPNPGFPQVYRIQCASWPNQAARCEMNRYIDRITLRRLLPNSYACIRNQTYGFDSTGVWVTNGCRGEFDVYVR